MGRDIRFCTADDGAKLAYAAVGKGPPLVWAAHWLSHLEFSWQSPVWRHWTEEFAKDHTFIHYDERGNGLSDWQVADLSLEAFVRDLEAVVDALALDRFPLIGSSKGGPTAIAYAVRHPERVSHLVLLGAYAKGIRRRGTTAEIEQREAMITLMRQGWAQDNPAYRQMFTMRFLPDGTLEELHALNDLQPLACSVDNAVRIERVMGEIDIVDLLPQVAVPTLVLHCRDDGSIPFEQGRLIASRIPGARFVELEGRNHILLPRNPAWSRFVAEVRDFLKIRSFLAPPDGSMPKPKALPLDDLTPRERAILEGIAGGLDNADIARSLGLSEKTVRNHITRVFDKIQVQHRYEAIVRARDAGLGSRPAGR
jgi:pimeloyl-ACP methyl ester carboxylesterase/DNA-binding CsgD family transcriptional regulator